MSSIFTVVDLVKLATFVRGIQGQSAFHIRGDNSKHGH